MRRLLLILSCLLLCGFGPVTMMGGGTPAAGGGGDPTLNSFTNFPIDFEATNCTTEAAITAAAEETACDVTTNAIAGTESARMATGVFVGAVTGSNVWTNPGGSTLIQCRWKMNLVTAGTFGFGNEHVRLNWFGSANGGAFAIEHDVPAVRAITHDNTVTSNINISTGTEYKVCMNYVYSTDVVDIYVDPIGGVYCAGATGSGTANGVDRSTGQEPNGWSLSEGSAGGSSDLIIDDVDCGTL